MRKASAHIGSRDSGKSDVFFDRQTARVATWGATESAAAGLDSHLVTGWMIARACDATSLGRTSPVPLLSVPAKVDRASYSQAAGPARGS
jgi:hypothetical protein